MSDCPSVVKKTPAASVESSTPTRIVSERHVAVGALLGGGLAVPEGAQRDRERAPATMRSDFRIPKMPAVAMAPTPMKRT